MARQIVEGIQRERPDWPIHGFDWRMWSEIPAQSAGSDPGDPEADRRQRNRARLSSLGLALPWVSAIRLRARQRRFETLPRPALDLFYALSFVPPGRIDCPIVPLVHDLFHLHHPEHVHPIRRKALDALADTVARAPRVQCVSRHTARDVEHRFGIPHERIDIVHPGIHSDFFAPCGSDSLKAFGLESGRFWLAVGMGEPRKNLGLLLDVFRARETLCTAQRPLVLVGAPAWKRGPHRTDLERFRREGRVRDLGLVPRSVLHALYANATAFLMPSLHEGFGIPLAEALAAGAPAVAADNSALTEVSGGFAHHCDAGSVDAWSLALQAVLDRDKDEPRTEAAKRHVRQFSPHATATAAIASLERAFSS